MKEVIKFAKFYYELGYSLNEAITMAINIAREVAVSYTHLCIHEHEREMRVNKDE